MNDRIPVTRAVFDGIEAVRRSGKTNMLDRPRVALLCDEMGFYESALWVMENRDAYSRAIFHGFEVTDEPQGN